VRTDGTLVCWGRNSDGQATPPAGSFTAVSAGCSLGLGVGVSAAGGTSWIGQLLPSRAAADAAPRVSTMSLSSRSVLTVRFSERVRVKHRSFGLECPVGHPKGFDLSPSPASVFTLKIKPRPLYADIPCRFVVRAGWISDMGRPTIDVEQLPV
jgi:hypothetical protein